jgi:hypothetical protein
MFHMLLAIARPTKRLDVANVVGTTMYDWDNVIGCQQNIRLSTPTTQATEVVFFLEFHPLLFLKRTAVCQLLSAAAVTLGDQQIGIPTLPFAGGGTVLFWFGLLATPNSLTRLVSSAVSASLFCVALIVLAISFEPPVVILFPKALINFSPQFRVFTIVARGTFNNFLAVFEISCTTGGVLAAFTGCKMSILSFSVPMKFGDRLDKAALRASLRFHNNFSLCKQKALSVRLPGLSRARNTGYRQGSLPINRSSVFQCLPSTYQSLMRSDGEVNG